VWRSGKVNRNEGQEKKENGREMKELGWKVDKWRGTWKGPRLLSTLQALQRP
jgi:hypothetical protein